MSEPTSRNESSFVVAPGPQSMLTIDLAGLMANEAVNTEVAGLLREIVNQMRRVTEEPAADDIPTVCILHANPCPNLASCTTYDAHGHGCTHLTSCGTFAPLIEAESRQPPS